MKLSNKLLALFFLNIDGHRIPLKLSKDCSETKNKKEIELLTKIPMFQGKGVCIASSPLDTARVLQNLKPDTAEKKSPFEKPNLHLSVEAGKSRAEVRSWLVAPKDRVAFVQKLEAHLIEKGYMAVPGLMQAGAQEGESTTYMNAQKMRMATVMKKEDKGERWIILSEARDGVKP